MFSKLCILIIFMSTVSSYENSLRVGIIRKEDEEIAEKIVQSVLRQELLSDRPFVGFETVTEVVPENDAWYYHRAVCRLLKNGVQVIIAPTSDSSFPLLASYSNEYKFPFLSPALPDSPEDPTAPDLIAKYGFGIRPSVTRPVLDLIRYNGWQNLVYIYDEDYGPEKLQIMFRVAYTVLNLHLIGFLRATSAEDVVQYLRKLNLSWKHNIIPVILDIDSSLATEVLLRMVHDVGIRRDSYNFLMTQPTLEDFWTEHEAELRTINVTGFLTVKPNFNRFRKVNEEWRKLFPFEGPYPNSSLSLSYYYYHDAALALSRALKRSPAILHSPKLIPKFPGCFQDPVSKDRDFGYPHYIRLLKEIVVFDGLTGHIAFDKWNETQSKRKDFKLTIVQSTSTGYKEFGTWSIENHGLKLSQNEPVNDQPGVLPQIDNRLRVTTVLNSPFMMLKEDKNGSLLLGNDRFEGFCKDIMDNICAHMHLDCELQIVEDGFYGRFDKKKGRWTGMIGEIIQGKADIAIADLTITGNRQRVVEFSDPFDMISFSILMKNPDFIKPSSSIFFIFSAFTWDVWICILATFILFCLLFHAITRYIGAPDTIESSLSVWGRKNKIIVNVWFAVGSALFQGTGVYPRSISSRILTTGWWFFTFIMACLFIASLTSQLQSQRGQDDNSPSLMQLNALSSEAIIIESVENGWPKIGVVSSEYTRQFIRNSIVPLFVKFNKYLDSNPSVVANSEEEGIKRVQESNGGYILLMDSRKSDYATRRKPCDLVAVHDSYSYSAYGIAMPLKSPLEFKIKDALANITERGLLGQLQRKWWIDTSECKKGYKEEVENGTLHSFSGLFCLLLIGVFIIAGIFVVQYVRKIQHREDRMQQLTFDDRNLEHHLPTPPPELLEEPPPVLNVPEIENRPGSENFNDFFERMRAGSS